MVAHDLRHTALAVAVEHQERTAFRAAHHGEAARHADIDDAEPAAPLRLLAARAGKIGGHRVPPPQIGDARLEAALDHAAERLGRQRLAQRRAIEREAAGVAGSGRFQERAALLHIGRDVLVVVAGQHAALPVTVEDDQVELVELDLEQLADREGDQRQLADGRAVLLLGRAQDREMDEVDGRVGLEEVAPGPLAGVRLARDQQHPQPVAHAVDDDHGAVVGERQLPIARRGLDLEHRRPGVLQHEFDDRVLAGGEVGGPERPAVAADGDGGGAARLARHVVDAQHHALLLPDDAVGRDLLDDQAAVDLVVPARQQHVEGRGELQRACAFRRIVDLAVGHGDDAGDAPARHVGQRPFQGGEQARAFIPRLALGAGGVRDPHHPDLGAGQAPEALLQLGDRSLGLVGAPIDSLAGRFVRDDHGHIRQGLAPLLHPAWIGERRQERGKGEGAQHRSARPTEQAEEDEHGSDRRQRDQDRQRDDRGEGDAGAVEHRYCPSRSRMAGTCTWSAL
jgi:hypothetical protein